MLPVDESLVGEGLGTGNICGSCRDVKGISMPVKYLTGDGQGIKYFEVTQGGKELQVVPADLLCADRGIPLHPGQRQ